MPFYSLHSSELEVTASLPPHIMDLWRRLALCTDQGDPFCCSPDWNLAYQQLFYPQSRIFWLSEGDSLVFLCEHLNNGPNEIILTPLEDGWLFGQPLLGENAAMLLYRAISALRSIYAGVEPLVILSGIQENTADARKLVASMAREFQFFRYRHSRQGCASLAGGIDGWLSRRSANHRAKLRKALRRATAAGIQFERCIPSNGEEARAVFARMLAVEHKSWKGRDHCGMAETPSKEFYSRLIARLAEDKGALVIFARHEDQDIGFIFGGITGEIYRGQQFSYITEWSAFSVGNILQYEKVLWLCEKGITRYDMGPVTGERMGYKHHWTESSREIQTWILKSRAVA